jgi:hypothetical protein
VTRSLIVHIGVHKTGTTSIQRFLARHRDALRNHGILYPSAGRPASHPDGHHEFPWLLTGTREVSAADPWQRLAAEVSASPCRIVLLSSEGFCMLRDPQAAEFAARVRDYDVRILMYVREPVSYLVSTYKMGITFAHRTESFGEFVQRELHRCDFRRSYRTWSNAFGAQRVTVRSFEAALGGAGLVADFIAQLGLPADALPAGDADVANRSPGDTVLQLVRALNRLQAGRAGKWLGLPLRWTGSALKFYPRIGRLAEAVAGPLLRSPLYSDAERTLAERLTAGFVIAPDTPRGAESGR